MVNCWRREATKYQILGITTVSIERSDWVWSEAAFTWIAVRTLRSRRQLFCRMLALLSVALRSSL